MTDVQTTSPLAGTIFPLPPRPAWATNETEWGTDGAREHSCSVGDVLSFGEDVRNSATVEICRYDLLSDVGMVVGETLACINANAVDLTPDSARALAALLVQAAELLEQHA